MVLKKESIDFPLAVPVNHYLLDTGRYVIQIDAGAVPLSGKDHKPDYILLTHWHWDHTYGITGMKGLNICINKESFKLLHPSGVLDRMREIVAGVEGLEAWSSLEPQTRVFIERYQAILNSLKEDHNVFWMSDCPPIVEGIIDYFECPGHSPDHVCFLYRDALFVGDNMAPGWNVTLIDPMAYMDTLFKIMSISSWATVYPGHGDPLKRDEAAEYASRTMKSKIKRMCRVLSSIEKNSTLDMLVDKVYGEGMTGVLRYVAARSLTGYLNNLENMGVVEVDKKKYPWSVKKEITP